MRNLVHLPIENISDSISDINISDTSFLIIAEHMYDGNPHLLVCTAMITLIGRKLPLCLVQAIQPTLQSSQVAQQAVAKCSIDQS